MTIRYKLGVDQIPVEVECEQCGYPYRDADGATQYENTHFDTEAEAWEAGAKECLAGIRLIGGDIRQIEAQLQRARERAGHAAVEWSNFSRARQDYEDRRCDHDPPPSAEPEPSA